MKISFLFLLSFLVFCACDKEPTACIEASPSTTIEVFDNITFKSCSENAFWYNWEVEEYQNGSQTFIFYNTEEVNYIYNDAGLLDVYLTVQSEKMKKEDFASIQITVNDVCYACTNGVNDSEICYSDYEDKQTFDAALANFGTAGFTCTKL